MPLGRSIVAAGPVDPPASTTAALAAPGALGVTEFGAPVVRGGGSREDEGRDPLVSRAEARPSESGKQDSYLRPLGPEAGLGVNAGSDRGHTESQGRGVAQGEKRSLAAGDALSASGVTQHGEPVGTRAAAELLRTALVAIGRGGEPTRELVQEIERLLRHALRVLGDRGMTPGTPRRGKGI
jgi:hypothetical protein